MLVRPKKNERCNICIFEKAIKKVMKLKTIELQNYRCYENNDFHFGSDTTLIIGKNGTGKSSLLSAIRKGMTFIFSNSDGNKLVKNNPNKVEGLNDWDTTFKDYGEGFQWPTNISYELTFDSKPLIWQFHKDKYRGKLHSKYYKVAQKNFEKYFSEQSAVLPLLGFYGDCFPHKRKENNTVVNKFNELLISSVHLPKDIGYTLWNDDGSITSSWFLRTKYILNEIQSANDNLNSIAYEIRALAENMSDSTDDSNIRKSQLKSLQNRFELLKSSDFERTTVLENEYRFVTGKVLEFFSSFNEINDDDLILVEISKKITTNSNMLFFNFRKKDSTYGGLFNEESLPMGYLRLVHIVYDIAYRWYLLNGNNPNFSGLVMIDELELHLHPSLQQTVLERFRRTFPGIQLIITTHSPIILSSFNANQESTKIIQLEKRDGVYVDDDLPNVYSMDYNSSLIDVMGVDISDKLLDAYINAYQFLKEDDKKLAKEYLNKIQDIFNGKIPNFVQDQLK
jgi:predicted ATP-binding protein involved in virulence